ncbi:MAG: hypothetical protein CMF69_07220, partial [Magnetovibrio sp.]|nr:hypothetical protein [Magnetovibrio sp.]
MGGVFLIVAFFSAAAEVLVHSARDKTQMIVAAHDLLYTIWPSGLLILQIRLENISPHLWDPWVLSMLSMPAWARFGLPGFIFITLFR